MTEIKVTRGAGLLRAASKAASPSTSDAEPKPAPRPRPKRDFIEDAAALKEAPREPAPTPEDPPEVFRANFFGEETLGMARAKAAIRAGNLQPSVQVFHGAGLKRATDGAVIRHYVLEGLRRDGFLK